ncbi:ribonuclease P mrp subunit pop7 protein [Babesia caballi]|uniref:Ribonuclease P mrp subunit pop7 protein n=1 Tax=Babesia caballi TaxID=5871 RepID=A0AAV4LRX3_BABCB|nr:ribonuclease P mrp subunit pop7 protein [Babesia caballi]
MSRQKGTHKGAKAAKVKAVGATGQCGGGRVAEEGGGGGAGGFYDVEGSEVRDVEVETVSFRSLLSSGNALSRTSAILEPCFFCSLNSESLKPIASKYAERELVEPEF